MDYISSRLDIGHHKAGHVFIQLQLIPDFCGQLYKDKRVIKFSGPQPFRNQELVSLKAFLLPTSRWGCWEAGV